MDTVALSTTYINFFRHDYLFGAGSMIRARETLQLFYLHLFILQGEAVR